MKSLLASEWVSALALILLCVSLTHDNPKSPEFLTLQWQNFPIGCWNNSSEIYI